MAYTGGIEFTDILYSTLEVFTNLHFAEGDKIALITNIWEFVDCHLKGEEAESEATHRQILDSRGTEIGRIIYDVEDGKDLRWEQSVVVGTTHQVNRWESSGSDNQEYHILIVRQGAENEYKRVGIGRVQQSYISRQQPDVCIL
jgi:hypothetical protein